MDDRPIEPNNISLVTISHTICESIVLKELHCEDLRHLIKDRRVYIFLDYDGTLTPIVADPAQARISSDMRKLLNDLANNCTVGIVTGRSMDKIRDFVKIDPCLEGPRGRNFLYAASHGFHIETGCATRTHQVGNLYLPELRAAADLIREKIMHIPGCALEDNHFAVSVHYRNAPEGSETEVEEIVKSVIDNYHNLKMTRGKMVFEVKLNLPWNKGRAVMWLLEAVGRDSMSPLLAKKEEDDSAEDDLPPVIVYAGDDRTDEDAFEALKPYPTAITILVSEDPARPTSALWRVHDTKGVFKLLSLLNDVQKENTTIDSVVQV